MILPVQMRKICIMKFWLTVCIIYFKEDEKGVAVMCKAMEDMRNEAAKMKAVHIARLMLDGGKLSYEDIAAYTELTIEEVEKIASEKKSA